MIKSMTGFGSKEAALAAFGKISVELRSSNHKFLETVFHLPEGFLFLEGRIKKEIEAKIKRGRVTCGISISGARFQSVSINNKLIKDYIAAIKEIRAQFHLKDEINLDMLMRLPGILSLAESIIPKEKIWPHLKTLTNQALQDLAAMRSKEGRALYGYLKNRAELLTKNLESIKLRFKKIIQQKVSQLVTEDEKTSFLKDTDITEEIERLAFHIGNFKNKLSKTGAMGKEMDFIAQEMQREANTMGAKSCDSIISSQVVQTKSQIEKIREQVQNVE